MGSSSYSSALPGLKSRTIKVSFIDFWQGIDLENFILMRAMRENFEVELVALEDADYVFYSVFGNEHWRASDRCVKIFYTGEDIAPDFNACDYAFGFEWLQYGDRYMRLPNYLATPHFQKSTLLMEHKHELPSSFDLHSEHPDFCSFVVSNGDANPLRRTMFEQLSAYKPVHSGGRYLNNIGGRVDDKLSFDSKHKFVIAFENSSHSGYTTEKIVDAFAARTVPIYWGDPDIGRVFNPAAFVNVSDYPDLDAVVREVIRLDHDDDAYMSMLCQPALRSESSLFDHQYTQVVRFLETLLSQSPIQTAYRRNREFWGQRYIEQHRALLDKTREKNILKLLKNKILFRR